MANRYHGSYRRFAEKIHGRSGPRRIRRKVQTLKHEEAQARNALTPHSRTKQHRLGRCTPNTCPMLVV